MTNIRVMTFGQGRFKHSAVVGTITLKIYGCLPDGDTRTEIPEEEAELLLTEQLDNLASSNDGLESLANAKIEISELDRIHDDPSVSPNSL